MKYVKPELNITRLEDEIFLLTSSENSDDYELFNCDWIFEE